MQLACLIHQYLVAFKSTYATQLLPGQLRAIGAIQRCRTTNSGEILLACTDCGGQLRQPLSCGHRSCPQCQNHEASQWLDRQQAKLLPVEYFMVTFTLPCELRTLAWRHQTTLYNLLFTTAVSTLKDFGLNPKQLGADIGMTAVLHTHSRRLDYHPHLMRSLPSEVLVLRKQRSPCSERWLGVDPHLFQEAKNLGAKARPDGRVPYPRRNSRYPFGEAR